MGYAIGAVVFLMSMCALWWPARPDDTQYRRGHYFPYDWEVDDDI